MKFNIGKTLGKAFNLLSRTGGQILIASLLIYFIPMMAYYYAVEAPSGYVDDGLRSWVDNPVVGVPKVVLGVTINIIYTIVIISILYRADKNEKTDLKDLRAAIADKFFTVYGVSIIFNILIGSGTVLLVVPGIIAALMFFVSVPVAVIEKGGVFESLARSRDLTRGKRWGLFGYLVIQAIMLIGIIVGLYLPTGLIEDGSWPALEPLLPAFYLVSELIISVFMLLLTVAAYIHLRDLKEGHRPEALADVFA